MKTVRLKDNVVAEIIPEYALPVGKWYGAKFASQCVEAPDEVGQRWVYDPETGIFSEPKEPEPMEEPIDIEATIIETTIDHEIRISELELAML